MCVFKKFVCVNVGKNYKKKSLLDIFPKEEEGANVVGFNTVIDY